MLELFTTVVYQPFFNILVLFYAGLERVTGEPDMGIAVIFLTILIRILLLPLSLASNRSAGERREIGEAAAQIDREFSADPIKREKSKKALLRRNKRVIISELIMLSIQVAIAGMLWKIFATGLGGQDIHLIYGFMPEVELPFNLIFLDKYDLSKTSFLLNLIQSLCIFVLETLSAFTSPYPVSRTEVVRMQLVLPLVSFIVFMGLPAGKKLFVITTLLFSIVLLSIRFIQQRFQNFVEKQEKKTDSDQVLVASN